MYALVQEQNGGQTVIWSSITREEKINTAADKTY